MVIHLHSSDGTHNRSLLTSKTCVYYLYTVAFCWLGNLFNTKRPSHTQKNNTTDVIICMIAGRPVLHQTK